MDHRSSRKTNKQTNKTEQKKTTATTTKKKQQPRGAFQTISLEAFRLPLSPKAVLGQASSNAALQAGGVAGAGAPPRPKLGVSVPSHCFCTFRCLLESE